MEFGKKGFRHLTMYVSAYNTEPSDYISLPVIRDGKAIGVVTDAVYENWTGIKLTLTVWVDLEFMNDKPNAIIFE